MKQVLGRNYCASSAPSLNGLLLMDQIGLPQPIAEVSQDSLIRDIQRKEVWVERAVEERRLMGKLAQRHGGVPVRIQHLMGHENHPLAMVVVCIGCDTEYSRHCKNGDTSCNPDHHLQTAPTTQIQGTKR